MQAERAAAESLGWSWRLREDRSSPGPERCEVLVVTSKVRVDEGVLRETGARLVLTTTSGVDHVDLEAAARRGVRVARCPQARRDPVVEHAVGALVWGMRQEGSLRTAAASGRWARAELPALGGRGLRGARIAVVGLGVIGSRVAEVLTFLGVEVLGVDPREVVGVRQVSLDEALTDADAVTLHCQLTRTSRGLMGAERLARLPLHAVVVNTSRGEVLDVEAAVRAVTSGRLRALHCDVFPEEPWPGMDAARHPRIALTPHAAGFVHDLGRRVATEVAQTLGAWGSGAPLPAEVPLPSP